MGSTTIGLMWGAKVRKGVDLYARWEAAPQRGLDFPAWPADSRLLGYWIGVPGSDRRDVPDLREVAISRIATAKPYARATGRAKARWALFAAWARERGVELPEPELWIAETEVA